MYSHVALKFLREQDELKLKRMFEHTIRDQFGVEYSAPVYDERDMDDDEKESKWTKLEMFQRLMKKVENDKSHEVIEVNQ